MVSLNINAAAARKAVPGSKKLTLCTSSLRGQHSVLAQKFNSDLAQTTSAMTESPFPEHDGYEVSEVVGQTLVSRKKMAKASKKMLVHTGAFGVKDWSSRQRCYE